MYKLILFLLTIMSLLFLSCKSSKDITKLTVASKQGDCVGVAPQKCLLIKSDNQKDWEFMYSNIEGFNYEPGFEYVLEIKKEQRTNPAADQSSIRYILVKEISKVRKTSDNLPTGRS